MPGCGLGVEESPVDEVEVGLGPLLVGEGVRGGIVDDAANCDGLDNYGGGARIEVGSNESTSLSFLEGGLPAIGQCLLHWCDSGGELGSCGG